MRSRLLALATLALALVLGGCAHPIQLVPEPTQLVGQGGANKIDRPVVLMVTDAQLSQEVVSPGGGGDKVSPNTTFDMNLTYDFEDGFVGSNQLSLNIRNLFDQKPPYYSSTYGYNSGISSPVGRLITVGLTSRL